MFSVTLPLQHTDQQHVVKVCFLDLLPLSPESNMREHVLTHSSRLWSETLTCCLLKTVCLNTPDHMLWFLRTRTQAHHILYQQNVVSVCANTTENEETSCEQRCVLPVSSCTAEVLA